MPTSWSGGGAGASNLVSSVFGRVGAIVAALGDYAASLIANDSNVAGATVSDALNNLNAEVVDLVGVSHTLSLATVGKYVRVTDPLANSVTVPLNATVPIPIGALTVIVQGGAGTTTIAAEGGVTLNTPPSKTLVLFERYSQVALKKVAINTWDVVGGLA